LCFDLVGGIGGAEALVVAVHVDVLVGAHHDAVLSCFSVHDDVCSFDRYGCF
jgi:hypothetical protein